MAEKNKYFLTKNEYSQYLYLIDSSRYNLIDLLKDLLKDENSIVYPENLSLLCEAIGTLHHIENNLDNIAKKSELDNTIEAWHVEKKDGLRFLIYYEAFLATKEMLLKNNLSFSLH